MSCSKPAGEATRPLTEAGKKAGSHSGSVGVDAARVMTGKLRVGAWPCCLDSRLGVDAAQPLERLGIHCAVFCVNVLTHERMFGTLS